MGQSSPSAVQQYAATGERAPLPSATIVCDVMLYRQGLAASIRQDGRIMLLDVVGGSEAQTTIEARRPDAVLLDGALPGCLQLAREIRAYDPSLTMVGFAVAGGARRMVDCAESGLRAFVDCDSCVDQLIASTLKAMDGEFSCPPSVSALMCERLAQLSAGIRDDATLTRRELEIASLVTQGLSNKEIARSLTIGPSTVKNHIHSILEKLNVRRRSAVAQRLRRSCMMDGFHRPAPNGAQRIDFECS